MYEDIVPLLEQKGFACVAPDLPGHGTASGEGPFTFEAAVDKLIEVIRGSRDQFPHRKTLVVGISLGGQVVLSLLLNPTAVQYIDAAFVSGASIHPPDSHAQWELPRMPQDQAWLDLMMEDAQMAGWDNIEELQAKSLNFTFDPPLPFQAQSSIDESAAPSYPPVLVVVGEHDIAMAKRDFNELCDKVKGMNQRSKGKVLEGAAHNHCIDEPELFARTIEEWAAKAL